eukprot:TRINITY_DN9957_c0_g2_i1.p1 TRINITY_DN9957_c0_g2~~TRINITY_DN9957_c0_g2_i1.p1  ORF type:complete len:712 (-),score=29.96 TRINITY_DN9957_c0_g2_i1:355-2490(-)
MKVRLSSMVLPMSLNVLLLASCAIWIVAFVSLLQDIEKPLSISQELRINLTAPQWQRRRPNYRQACMGGEVLVTMTSRGARAALVPLVLQSLLDQTLPVDCIVVILNNYAEIPSWFPSVPQLVYVVPDSDLGARGRFFDRALINAYEYHLVAQDDIFYPHDFAQRMITTLQQLQGEHLVGAHCRNLSLLAAGALTWFENLSDDGQTIIPQMEISEDISNTLFPALVSNSGHSVHLQHSFKGGWADVVASGTFGYVVASFEWQPSEVPTAEAAFDYFVAFAASSQGLKSWCIARKESWFQELPQSELMRSDPAPQRSQKEVAQVVGDALRLELLLSQRSHQNRSRRTARIVRQTKRETLLFPRGLLPMRCGPYQTANHRTWECKDMRLCNSRSRDRSWRVRLDDQLSQKAIGQSASLPALREDCKAIHVVIPFQRPAQAYAVRRSIMSSAYQLYSCVAIWLIAIDNMLTEHDSSSPTYERLMDATCRRSGTRKSPKFTTVRGVWGQNISVGCMTLSPPARSGDRDTLAHRVMDVYGMLIAYTKPMDIILTLPGGEELIHPQALSIVAEAYKQRGCWCTWTFATAGYSEDLGSVSQEVIMANSSNWPREQSTWLYAAPRSFLAKLFHSMTPTDFQHDGQAWRIRPTYSGHPHAFHDASGSERSCYVESAIYGCDASIRGGCTPRAVLRRPKVSALNVSCLGNWKHARQTEGVH